MKISSLGLEAFYEVAKQKNFTLASRRLGLTQSALSQRIAKLESDLEIALFTRDRAGIGVTPAGERLLRYCESQKGMEDELLSSLKGTRETLAGEIRIAGYSSIVRSVLIPKLASFQRKHPDLRISFQTHEVRELFPVLLHSRADFIVADSVLNREGVLHEKIGVEEYVVIRSSRHESRPDVFLDHDPSDETTAMFFSHQPKRLQVGFERNFMGDVYGIIDGVREGFGRAVMSRHLVEGMDGITVEKGYSPLVRPLYLHYFQQPFYPKAFQAVKTNLSR